MERRRHPHHPFKKACPTLAEDMFLAFLKPASPPIPFSSHSPSPPGPYINIVLQNVQAFLRESSLAQLPGLVDDCRHGHIDGGLHGQEGETGKGRSCGGRKGRREEGKRECEGPGRLEGLYTWHICFMNGSIKPSCIITMPLSSRSNAVSEEGCSCLPSLPSLLPSRPLPSLPLSSSSSSSSHPPDACPTQMNAMCACANTSHTHKHTLTSSLTTLDCCLQREQLPPSAKTRSRQK